MQGGSHSFKVKTNLRSPLGKNPFFHATVSLIWTLTEKTFNSYLGEEARVGVKDHAARACSSVLSEPDS
jgi:hypothetical protein